MARRLEDQETQVLEGFDPQNDVIAPQQEEQKVPLSQFVPSDEDIRDFVKQREYDRDKSAQAVAGEVFTTQNGYFFSPTFTQKHKEQLESKLPEGLWQDGVDASVVTTEDFSRWQNRLGASVSHRLMDAHEDHATTHCRLEYAKELIEDGEQRNRRLTEDNDQLEHAVNDLDREKEELDKTKKVLIGVSAVLGIVAIALAGWVAALKTAEPEVDPNNLSDNPEVAQLQQDVMKVQGERDDLQAKLDQSNRDLEQAKRDKDAAEKRASSNNAGDAASKAELDKARSYVDKLSNENADLKSQIGSKDNELQQKDFRISQLEDKVDDLRSQQGNNSQQPAVTITQTVPASPEAGN